MKGIFGTDIKYIGEKSGKKKVNINEVLALIKRFENGFEYLIKMIY